MYIHNCYYTINKCIIIVYNNSIIRVTKKKYFFIFLINALQPLTGVSCRMSKFEFCVPVSHQTYKKLYLI